ncbi:MAG: 50S ribosomal protein L23 [Candidatus Omnitrophica bacterium CG12_big_fil_rev_8_21_14_0_65_43_15]|uniref:Large ribosomal subunit protein uL23 n=1 Tax=Candidatus Taenaricola geysiri TaxID=1974752 RepID=A0A2J0LMF6_9BACT|nr:MAG: 50S ribosomal protein L23 [Candidatus Omnitrophica bacterium CG1_02_43_210]PIR66055.1 MAG: 50S ribosomal protein L23 [Candidatus Omnitrophica bacterium CG10_big_fil_rev_8_21_14_0_10_43_8]PIW65886.1 MAG: 50S ribosomal protein L23 [Candidatus Omnitrophica bacterium CG12_big_fil_rev_8_21_14_0_65_43_15]PIW79782.1 MAG: 50S ribosomal protein L23 [Candidatus Omnitrophica bacterium CG_4_8_14_3_um_filter_43_15]PIY84826.1 MAG: 50S ribosomal protein L23 [Candidatus Omnitrophica bacterium CG_4_10_1
MKDLYSVIKNLMRTEKSTHLQPLNKYLFKVDTDATKIEIKKAVETVYKVKVDSVNTVNMPGKLKRVRYKAGYTSDWKKAIVTLKAGSKIDMTA